MLGRYTKANNEDRVGHVRLGGLPKTLRWRRVLELLDEQTLDASAVAHATTLAAELVGQLPPAVSPGDCLNGSDNFSSLRMECRIVHPLPGEATLPM